MTAPKHFLDILGLGRRPLEHRRVPMNERWELGTGVRALNGRVWVISPEDRNAGAEVCRALRRTTAHNHPGIIVRI